MDLDRIASISGYKILKDLGTGYSNSPKYILQVDGKKLFVKLSEYEIFDNLENMLTKASIPHAKILEIGKIDNWHYIIEEFVDKPTLKETISQFTEKQVFDWGHLLGKSYANLRSLHKDKQIDKDTFKRLKYKVKLAKEQLINVLSGDRSNSDKLKNIGDMLINQLTEDICFFEDSVLIFGNTDIKPNNFIIDTNMIVAIDIDYTDYYILPYALSYCLWAKDQSEREKNQAFASGYIFGLFGNKFYKNFDKQMNFAFALVCTRYIIKYITNQNADGLKELLKVIKKATKTNKIEIFEELQKIYLKNSKIY